MKIAKQTEIVVEPTVLKIYCKVCDNFTASLEDKAGKILNWNPPSADDIQEWVNGQ